MQFDPVLLSSRAMEELVLELPHFLELLDREYLSAAVREKKNVIANILHRIQANKDHHQKSEVSNCLPAPPQMPLPEIPHQWLPPDIGPPPLPSTSLPEGYYEEAVPLSPGKAPEYITSHYDSDAMSSSYESYDEEEEDGKGQKMRHQWPSEEASMDLVKDARICAFLLRKKRFGQWTKLLCVIKDNKLLCYKSSKDHTPQMELVLTGCSITHIPKDGKKKKHELKITHQGADALVLAVQSKEQAEEWLKVIRDVCHSCNGTFDSDGTVSSSPVHKSELEKKFSYERPSSDGEANHENGVIDGREHVKGKKNTKAEQKGTVGKVTGKKITKIIGLGKKKPSTDEQTSSAEEDVPTCGYLNVLSNNRWRERWCRVKDNQLILHKDRADLKTHMASIPLRGCEVIPGLDSKHPLAFRLLRNLQEVAVLEASTSERMGRWLGVLLAETGSSTDPAALHYDYIDVETTANVIQLAKQSFCFTNKRAVSPNPYLDNPINGYSCPSGLALHYDDVPCGNGSDPEDTYSAPTNRCWREEGLYENAELYENSSPPKLASHFSTKSSRNSSAEKLTTNHYKSPVSSKLSSASSITNTSVGARGFAESASQLKGKKAPISNGLTTKQKVDRPQQKKANGNVPIKRNNSSTDQYKYGKNRVEADAKRLQIQEEQLMKKKQDLRNKLSQLRKEKKDVRAAIEANTGRKSQAILEDKLKRLEDDCKKKEQERVNLELELTEVKDSLKKALNGGITLGLTIEPKSGTSSPQSPVFLRRTVENSPVSSCDTSDTEPSMLPVNSAAILKRQPPQKASPGRGHVLRKAKEWEMKSGT
ncbi:LOW QUALITY PROTEIN: actin filament-associated protein 1 [Erpetoichthys calabaricus]|uniref:LOW QUALITY PROTEIN: actin filament-associated protein 1 n=1 Tax=Erpetoichthys calabaricus TaxID=27687 RepID=UPI00223450B5|nr:LOW QUALITY PROTEIN: actin filament-associated protein 1 [Erpetoichthys calabaricus]